MAKLVADMVESKLSTQASSTQPMDGASLSREEQLPLSKRMLVLVVERDPHVRALEAHFSKEAGFEVAFANDGREALQQAQDRLPDIVITEILVPKLDGLSLCRELKADPRTKSVTVLVFSILAAKSRAAEAGADAFLMKPLAEQRLLSTVKSLIEQRHKTKG